jgi:hypothetical protein
MRTRLDVVASLTGLAVLVGCGSSSPSNPTPTLSSFTITGNASVPAVGQTSQLTATATLSSGSAQNVTTEATWQSSNTAVATVSSSGLVSAQGYGGATITAAYQGMNAQTTFTVTVAGAWLSSPIDGRIMTWTLSQSGNNVTGTLGINPQLPVTFSSSTVTGTVSGATFTWAIAMTVATDPQKPACVGTTTTVNGSAQIAPSGTSMSVTALSANAPCDNKTSTLSPNGPVITFTRQ